MSDYNIKGSSIQSKLDYVQATHGDKALEELKGVLRAHGILLLLQSSWYPAGLYEKVNRFIAERFLGGDLRRLVEVGSYSSSKALDSVYRVYLETGDFARFLERLSSLHERFFDKGRMEVKAAERSCEILLSGAPSYPAADMQVAAGFYAGAARKFGLANVQCDVQRQRGGMRFLLTWDAAKA